MQPTPPTERSSLKDAGKGKGKDHGARKRVYQTAETESVDQGFTRKAVWQLVEGRGPYGLMYERFTVFLILINVAAFIVGTLFDHEYNVNKSGQYAGPDCSWCDVVFIGNDLNNGMSGTSFLEVFTAVCFTIDYCFRYWSCLEDSQYESRFDFMISFFSLVDLASTVPTYLGLLLPVNFVASQFLRMFRLFRMMRAEGRYSKAFTLFDDVVAAKANVLKTAGFVGAVIWTIMAGFNYVASRFSHDMIYCPKCPDVDVNKCSFDIYGMVDCTKAGCSAPNQCWNLFESIPSSMFQTLLNLFGEFPLSDRQHGWGMVISAFAAIVAQVAFGIPCGIIGSGFEEQMDKLKEEQDESAAPAVDTAEYGATVGTPVAALAEEVDGESVRGQIYNFIHGKTEAGVVFQYVIVTLIITSTLSFMLHTLQSVNDNATLSGFLSVLEACTVAIFTAEYILSAYSIGADPAFSGWHGLWLHTKSFNQVVDLVAILPFFVAMAMGGSGLVFVRAMRLIRLIKTDTFVNAFSVLETVVIAKSDILIITGFAALVFWVFFSSLMYFIERGNPDPAMASYYHTIPEAMWMTMLNLSGEVPLPFYTLPGKIVVSIIGIFAVGFISIPIGALASGFQEYQEDNLDDTPDEQDEPDASPASAAEIEDNWLSRFAEGKSTAGRMFSRLILLLIFSTILMAIMETVPGMNCETSADQSIKQANICSSFNKFEAFAVICFTLEYIISLFAAPSRIDFVFSFHSVIDVVAIVPWYISLAIPGGWVDQNNTLFLMFRVLRLLKLDKEVPSLTLIDNVFRLKRQMLIVTGIISGIFLIIFASMMYLAESNDTQTLIGPVPLYGCSSDDCSQSIRYQNVFSSMGYVNIHLTGDYPIIDYNIWGRLVAFFMIVVGVGIVSIPSGLIADGFKTVVAEKMQGEDNTLLRDYDVQLRQLDDQAPREFQSGVLNTLQEDLNTLLNGKKSRGKVERSFASDMLNKAILVAILVNVACVLLESVPSISRTVGNNHGNIFDTLELLCVILFSFEFFARLFSVTKDKEHLYSRWCYMTTFFGIVDLATIAPFYITLALQAAGTADVNSDSSDVFRLIRLFRLLELEHFITAFTVLDNVFWRSRGALLATGILALCIWLISATFFYVAELDNPNWCLEFEDPSCATVWTRDCVCATKSTFDTMPHSLYYTAIIVFAGEWPMVDFTIVGKFVCFATCIISIGLAALPIGSLFDSFSAVLEADGDLDKAMAEEDENEN